MEFVVDQQQLHFLVSAPSEIESSSSLVISNARLCSSLFDDSDGVPYALGAGGSCCMNSVVLHDVQSFCSQRERKRETRLKQYDRRCQVPSP